MALLALYSFVMSLLLVNSNFIDSILCKHVVACSVVVIVFVSDVIVGIVPSMLIRVVPLGIITGICEDGVGRKHERGFVDVKVRGVLGVVRDGVGGFLFLVV